MILIKIEKYGHCFYCIYRDIIEYRDNFLDSNREMIFLISPNPIPNGLYIFTDGGFISPSVPMVNYFIIGTDEYSIFSTDGILISPSVRMETDGRNNFTKLTVGMLVTVLDNLLKYGLN